MSCCCWRKKRRKLDVGKGLYVAGAWQRPIRRFRVCRGKDETRRLSDNEVACSLWKGDDISLLMFWNFVKVNRLHSGSSGGIIFLLRLSAIDLIHAYLARSGGRALGGTPRGTPQRRRHDLSSLASPTSLLRSNALQRRYGEHHLAVPRKIKQRHLAEIQHRLYGGAR